VVNVKPRNAQHTRIVCIVLWVLVAGVGARFLVITGRNAVTPSHSFPAYYLSARLLADGDDPSRFYRNEWFLEHGTEHGVPVGEVYGTTPPTTARLMLPLAWMGHGQARSAGGQPEPAQALPPRPEFVGTAS
jgi:hypothetical protein